MARDTLVAGIVAELMSQLGLDGAVLDGDGQLSLRLGDLPLTLAYRAEPADLLWLQSDLGTVGSDDAEAFGFLLRYGYLSWMHGRMTIAVDDAGAEGGEHVYAFSCMPAASLTADRLREAVELMATTAIDVRKRLSARSFCTDVADEDNPPFTPGSGAVRA